MKNNRFLLKVNTVIYTLIVLGIFVVVYSLLTVLPWRWDVTANKKHTLSSQTVKIVQNISKQVEITAFCQDGSPQKEKISDLLNNYTRLNKKLSLTFVDPDKQPSLTSRYKIKNYNTVVFQSGTQRKDILDHEIFFQNYGPEYQVNMEFRGESAFTNALIAVTSKGKKRLCFLVGHEEALLEDNDRDGLSGLKDILEQQNYNIKSLNLILEDIDENDILVVAAPKRTFIKKELSKLTNFFTSGGKGLFLLDAINNSGLAKWLDAWDIGIGNNIIIDTQRNYFFDASSPLPEYLPHEITDDLLKQRIPTVFFLARSIHPQKTLKESPIKITPLLQSSSGSWAESNYQSKKVQYDKDIDQKGPVVMGLAMEKPPTGNFSTKMVVFGDVDFISNKALSIQGNIDLFLNSIAWLAEEKDKIAIRPLKEETSKITLTPLRARLIYIISLFVIPGFIILMGIVVWLRRRRL